MAMSRPESDFGAEAARKLDLRAEIVGAPGAPNDFFEKSRWCLLRKTGAREEPLRRYPADTGVVGAH